tara:strand:+ start:4163 stop:4774 length:612 start_codon:yes stop_codon:yes gene_type:complete
MSEKKCIKYFAAHYCPHSNEHSRAYHLINTLFKNYYPDVTVEVFWGEDISEENKHEFLNANAQYVPTITNSKYANIDLSLPKDYNTEGKTDTELTYAILENIYNQLDKEKDESIKTQKEELINTKKGNCGVKHIENYDTEDKNSKSFMKKTLESLNNNKFVGFIFISLLIYLIVLPFCKNIKKKGVSSEQSFLQEDSNLSSLS